jgi:hypothetical protein
MSKRFAFVGILFVNTFSLSAQNGYVVTKDSTIYGYLQFETVHMDGEKEILVWKTKKDKKPIRISQDQVIEFAYKKDTFRLKLDPSSGRTVLKNTKEEETIEGRSPNKGSSIGWGVGLDFGGIGVRAAVWPTKSVAFFAGAGYNLVGIGWNAGLNLKIPTEGRVVPYFSGMYGYNAAIKVTGALEFQNTYYGPSVGFGLEFHTRKQSMVSVGFIVPFRSSAFHDDFDDFTNSGVDFTLDPTPITISIGFHLY